MAQIIPMATPGRLRTSTSVPSLADPREGIRGKVAACRLAVDLRHRGGPLDGRAHAVVVVHAEPDHGQLDAIYSHIQSLESQKKVKVDLLLICGDFQATRDNHDLQSMAVPPKYKHMGDFHK